MNDQGTLEAVEADPLLSANVERLEISGRTVFIVGTAHVSRASADLAEEVIRLVRPQFVAVELCASRFASLQDPDRWKNMDLFSVIREGKAYVLMTQLALAGFQRKLGNELQIKPGEEMMRAISVAKEIGAEIVLADRDVRTTLKRTWSALGFWSLCKLGWGLLAGLFAEHSIDIKEIERLKQADALEELMRDFSAALPQVRTSLIDERDQYLAAKIGGITGDPVVAIVGAGHVPGIRAQISDIIDLGPLEEIPKPSLTRQLVPWLLPALFVAMVIYGIWGSGTELGIEMISSWIWITALAGAIGAAVALAHPLTILSAAVVAPYATLNPFLASGWIAGLVEAWIRKPRVGDLDTIADDLTSVKGWWRNRVSRVLLVVATTNIVASIGTLIALGKVAVLLK